jgi:hypothetical protein
MIAIMMPLSSSCLRAKKAFSGNLITLVAVQSVLKQPYYLIKIVKDYCILLNGNTVIRLDEKRKYRVTKVIRLLMLIERKVLINIVIRALYKTVFAEEKRKEFSHEETKRRRYTKGGTFSIKRSPEFQGRNIRFCFE